MIITTDSQITHTLASTDDHGTVYLARGIISGKQELAFPGSVRVHLGEDQLTPILMRANVPTATSIITLRHFEVLCCLRDVRH